MSYIDVTGKTEEEALRKGLEQLGMDRDDVSVSILERAKSGFLGIGASPARIRITYGPEEADIAAPAEVKIIPEEKPAAPVQPAPAKTEKPAAPRADKPRTDKPHAARPRQERRSSPTVPAPSGRSVPFPPPLPSTCRSATTRTPSASSPSCPACWSTWTAPPR